jgi:multiple sugar transport system substrate-binding protein
MFTLTRRTVAFAAVLVLLGLAACGGGAEEGGGDNRIVVWTGDTIPDRVAKTKDIIAAFTQSTGIQVELVGVDEDQFNQLLTSAAAAGELPDVVGSQPLAAVRTLSANDLLNTEATKVVVDTLGAETFSARSLELTRQGEEQLSVPTDAWSVS